MPHTVLIHLINEEPIVAEVERIPEPTDQVLLATSVRRRDGREITYLLPESNIVVFPWARIHCVEIMPTEAEEQVVSFVRE
jgi:hypothetical protein